jgi:hypothetical protein
MSQLSPLLCTGAEYSRMRLARMSLGPGGELERVYRKGIRPQGDWTSAAPEIFIEKATSPRQREQASVMSRLWR